MLAINATTKTIVGVSFEKPSDLPNAVAQTASSTPEIIKMIHAIYTSILARNVWYYRAMKQVTVIHGGTTFANYDDYLQMLATKTLYVDRLTYKPMWKELLQEELGNDYQVLLPKMPNATNARYSEWKVWFSHLTEVITDDCILVGHSMGAIFLAKYLSENEFPRSIKATILVAAPYNDDSGEDLNDFKLEAVSDLFRSQAGKVVFFFGSDDPVISQTEIQNYKNDLPTAEFNILPAPDHFVRADFPELATLLKNI